MQDEKNKQKTTNKQTKQNKQQQQHSIQRIGINFVFILVTKKQL